MPNSKPAPGPYHYERDSHLPYVVDSTQLNRIADVYPTMGRGSIPQAIATARLLAASHDLRAVLHDSLTTWAEPIADRDLPCNGGDMVDWFFNRFVPAAQAAMRKADGV
jgi:hypothetical protein